ncbi:CLUMA_CG000518, isoform A [Clunio marinus]|uniref:CLUMA_CG000518, isoform A n=1 Tax=Clunio marinus TaxID=568069 RepID=A0A1J1HF98_9DIPT|nr:CLUMA_CG000518, isoform A [Clunio marinus]
MGTLSTTRSEQSKSVNQTITRNFSLRDTHSLLAINNSTMLRNAKGLLFGHLLCFRRSKNYHTK